MMVLMCDGVMIWICNGNGVTAADVSGTLRRCIGDRRWSYVERIFDWAVNKPNPLLQIVYIIVVYGGYTAFVMIGLPRIPVNTWHRQTTVITMIICAISFIVTSRSNPGIINKENYHTHADSYAFDGVLFTPDVQCVTCHHIKPAVCTRISSCVSCHVVPSKQMLSPLPPTFSVVK
jgi:hypothetical protein